MRKLTLREVKQKSIKLGFEFIDKEYRGNKFKHSFKCLIDNQTHQSTMSDISSGYGLKCCGIRKNILNGKNKRLHINQGREISLKNGFKFLDKEYIGNKHRHNFLLFKA